MCAALDALSDPRHELISTHADKLEDLARLLLPVLMEVFASSVNPSVRRRWYVSALSRPIQCVNLVARRPGFSPCSLIAILRLAYYTPTDALVPLLPPATVAGLISALIGGGSARSVVTGVQLAAALIDKAKTTYAPGLAREGVLADMNRLQAVHALHHDGMGYRHMPRT